MTRGTWRLGEKSSDVSRLSDRAGRADTYHETTGLEGPEMVRVGARHSVSVLLKR